MRSKPNDARDGQPNRLDRAETAFTGYWFKVPSEIDQLMQLSPAQMKVYLVVTHAIQRDRNEGLLAMSQIAERADLSERHARKAIETLCQRRLLIRVNRVTGAELTRKEEWNGRTVKYANPIQWKQKDTSNPVPTGQRSGPEDDERNALRNGVRESEPADCDPGPAGEGNLRPVGERYLRPVGQRHSEYSESLECKDLKPAQPQVEPSAFSGGLSLSEANGQADYRFASAKSAEGSPGNLVAGETTKTQKPRADAPAEAAGGEAQNPSMRAKPQNLTADDEATLDPEGELEDVLSCFEPTEREEWDGTGVPAWVPGAALAAAPGASAEAVCAFLRQKADAGWQPRKWATIPAMVRDAFAPKPKAAHVEPWTGLDVTNVQKWLGAFMDGEEPPPKLVSWIIDLATEYSLRASDIPEALSAAWKRGAAPGQKNAPRSWNWFYEVLRAAFISGYAARLPEAPAVPHPAHHASTEEMMRGTEALDSLVASYRCKCGAEIRQYTDRVEGTCTCGQAKPMSRAGTVQMPAAGKRSAAGGRQ